MWLEVQHSSLELTDYFELSSKLKVIRLLLQSSCLLKESSDVESSLVIMKNEQKIVFKDSSTAWLSFSFERKSSDIKMLTALAAYGFLFASQSSMRSRKVREIGIDGGRVNDAFFANKTEKAFQHFKAPFIENFGNFFFFQSLICKVLMGFSIVIEV